MEQEWALPGRALCQHPPPALGGADLPAEATPTRSFPSGDRRAPVFSPLLRQAPGGEEVGLESSIPPSVPTSNLNPGTSVDGLSKQAQAGIKKEGTPGLTQPGKGPDPRSPRCPLCSSHCPGYLVRFFHLQSRGCCRLVELSEPLQRPSSGSRAEAVRPKGDQAQQAYCAIWPDQGSP